MLLMSGALHVNIKLRVEDGTSVHCSETMLNTVKKPCKII